MPTLVQMLRESKDWILYLHTVSVREHASLDDLKKLLLLESKDAVVVVNRNGEPVKFIPGPHKKSILTLLGTHKSIADLPLPRIVVLSEESDISEMDAALEQAGTMDVRFFLITRKGIPYGFLSEVNLMKALAAAMTTREKQEFVLRTEMKKMRESLDYTLHDIKGPLTIISHCAHLLEMAGDRDAKGHELIKKIILNSSKIIDLASGFLSAGQISAGHYKGVRSWIEAHLFISQVADDLADVATMRGIHLRVEGIPPGRIFIDKSLMTRALQNLVENAIKHSPQKVDILITSEVKVIKGLDHLLIHVIDEGPGIPHGQLDEIFTAFKQVSGTQQDLIPGVGLGLTIASKFVEAHGGWLEAHNNPNGGATFTLVIPNFETDKLAAAPEPAAGAVRPMRILVVDDDPDIVEYVAETIRDMGHQPIGVANSIDALQEIRAHKPDLALIDIIMPGMSGLELLEAMQMEGLVFPAYLFSGKFPEETAAKIARDNGAEGYLNKPLELAKLRPVINRHMGHLSH